MHTTEKEPPKMTVAVVGPHLEGLAEVLSDQNVTVTSGGPTVQGVITTYGADPLELQSCLRNSTNAKWVQLPTAGIELFSNVMQAEKGSARVWTSAKGAYAEPVAEHALMLTLALLRDLRSRVEARSWGKPAGRSLHGLHAVVVGAGGVAQEIIRLFKMFDTDVTVVRRKTTNVDQADRTVSTTDLPHILPTADVVVLAAALTSETQGVIGRAALNSMRTGAILVNIGRGGLVDTEALTRALASNQIYGAGLDVTDPEPLPDDHPLWDEARCIITPHSADTMEMIIPLYLNRVRDNIVAFKRDETLHGVVDIEAGY